MEDMFILRTTELRDYFMELVYDSQAIVQATFPLLISRFVDNDGLEQSESATHFVILLFQYLGVAMIDITWPGYHPRVETAKTSIAIRLPLDDNSEFRW